MTLRVHRFGPNSRIPDESRLGFQYVGPKILNNTTGIWTNSGFFTDYHSPKSSWTFQPWIMVQILVLPRIETSQLFAICHFVAAKTIFFIVKLVDLFNFFGIQFGCEQLVEIRLICNSGCANENGRPVCQKSKSVEGIISKILEIKQDFYKKKWGV